MPQGLSGVGPSGTWADFDDDRDVDLVRTNFGQSSVVLRNDSAEAFVPITTLAAASPA